MASNTAEAFRSEQENVVYVGAEVSLKGEITVSDLLVVDGEVEGEVAARAVIVGPSGVLRGRIAVAEADIAGSVSDHLEVSDFLVIRSTGRVEGRVSYGEIELEKGAVLTGDLSAAESPRAPAKPVARPAVAVTVAGDGADEEEPAPVPAAERPGAGSIDRLSEAVRAAKSGGAAKPQAGSEAQKRALRSPLMRRRTQA
jgi:cytoskeletal protein CcmA (bactofilin family)